MDKLASILAAVSSASRMIKTVAEMPGVQMLPYATTVSNALGAMERAAQAGKDVMPYVAAITDSFGTGNQPPPPAELGKLDARIAELEADVDKPLPEREAGEPE